jgi:hypothetical protein
MPDEKTKRIHWNPCSQGKDTGEKAKLSKVKQQNEFTGLLAHRVMNPAERTKQSQLRKQLIN